jgi:predicted MPP superfamily phosphohydrolase
MFGLIFTTVISLCHLYVFWRATSVSFFQNQAARRGLIATGLLLWLLFVVGRLYGHGQDNTISHWLELAAMTWMGTLFLLTSALLAVELLTGGGWLLPRLALPLRGIALPAGLFLAAIALYQGNLAPVVNDFAVSLPGLPATMDGTVVVAMSDLHLGTLRREEWLAARIAQVRELHPDLVLLVGDIFEGHGEHPQEQSILLLRTLTAPLGVWGVPGNHEFYGGPQTIQALTDGGVKLLRNSWNEVRPGLVLAGVEEHTFNRQPEEGAGRITKALAGHAPGATILLSHKPWGAREAAENGVGLMLSGHTHGGQLWPFNYLVERFFPLLAGRYQVNNMPILVCRGTGTWGAPMRLWQPGEIMKITLRAGP